MSGGSHTFIIVFLALVTTSLAAPKPPSPSVAPSPASFDLFMPDVQPQQADTYLCNAIKVEEAHRYLTEFEPKANSHDAHHMLLYGCEQPGMEPGDVWNCGEMASSTEVQTAPVCQSGHNILYAWGMDAPKLQLPEGVGFDVGQETSVKYLVLQVHYKNVSKFVAPENGKDNSGLIIHTSPTKTPKEAGVYLMVTGGSIPAHTTEYFEAACEYEDDKEIVPFAYRTHAHSLGRVISGYRIRDGEWTELGRKDPRKPQMFYNVTTPGVTVKKGDILAARCTMQDDTDHEVEIGSTQKDEMCNFYVMYYVENPPKPATKNCVTAGPPRWYWQDFEDQEKLNLAGAPDTASVMPGTSKVLERTVIEEIKRSYEDDGNGQRTLDWLDGSEYGYGPNTYQDSALEQVAQAYDDPNILLYLIEELAKEEEEDELARKQWMAQKQRMMEQQMMYPQYNRF